MDPLAGTASIPELKGEADLGAWKDILIEYLRMYDLEKYIFEDVPCPEDKEAAAEWEKGRATVRFLIKSSTLPVRQTLLNYGLNLSERSPKKIYDIILKAIPRPVGQLMAEFCQIKRAKFDSMQAFQTRIQYLKTRLAQLGCEMTDKAMMWVTINALEESDPELCRWLQRDMQGEELTWDKLMAELASIHAKEITRAFSVTKPRHRRS